MNTKIIKLDINAELLETITAKQGDTKSRFILFNLYDGVIPFDLSGRTVRVYGNKKDNTTVFNDLEINDAKNGYCTLELTNQMLAVEGMYELELVIFEGNKRLSTMPFTLNVVGSKYSEDAIMSTNEFTALANALKTVGGIENKADKKEVEKLSSQLDTIEGKTFEVVNCVGLGIDTTNSIDISVKVNQIIQENQGKTIFIPKGNYRVDNPIIIKGVDFICEGTIFVGNNVAFHVNSPYIKVNINKIVGANEIGTGVLIGSSTNTITNSDIYINKIDFCENAILISPEGDNGVQCSKIHFNTLYKCKYGIRFKPSNTGIPWINENTFYCGSINSRYAIYVKKGDDMVDPFNNNKFLNVSIEFSSYPFILEYMNTNTFENIRCAEGENTIADYMFNLSSCNLNTFTSNIPNSISRINEVSCNNNIYDFIIQREVSGTYIGASMKTNNGRKFLKKSEGISHDGSVVGNYNKTTNTIDYVQKLGLINMSCDANKSSILVLDSRYGVDGSDYNEFMVDVQFIGNSGLIQIKDSSGTILLDQSKLTVGKHLVKYIGGNWYSFKAS